MYHSHLIADNITNPRHLWKTINNLLHRSAIPSLPNLPSVTSIAQQFATFFSEKVTKLNTSIPPVNQSPHFPQPPRISPKLTGFRLTDISEITKLVLQSPTKQCELDPIPTFLLKESISVLAPTITEIVNLSLSSGTFPSSFKLSIVTPLLIKPSLDKNNLSSYRPISNLSFLSKLTERVVKTASQSTSVKTRCSTPSNQPTCLSIPLNLSSYPSTIPSSMQPTSHLPLPPRPISSI